MSSHPIRRRVDTTPSVDTAFSLVERLRNGEIAIPAHQRDFCWSAQKQSEFLDSVMCGLPTQSIIFRSRDGYPLSLEDGRQRLTTLQRFMDGESKTGVSCDPEYQGKLFGELPPRIQSYIQNYKFSTITYKNASTEDAIEIFDRFQNGIPLTVGERFHSLKEISPIVGLTTRILMTAGGDWHQRATRIWGDRSGKDSRRKALTNAVVLMSGLAFGPGYLTKKWGEITSPKLHLLSKPVNEEETLSRLNKLMKIYEAAGERFAVRGKAILNTQWNVGKISGYIIYSLWKFPAESERLHNGWVDFLVKSREDPTLLSPTNPDGLHADDTKARSFNDERWERGYLRVFNPAEARARAAAGSRSSSTDDSDSESDSESM